MATFDKYIQLSALGLLVRRTIHKTQPWLILILGGITGKMFYDGNPGWLGFGLMGAGTFAGLSVWRSQGVGLPLLPLLVLQQLVVFGLPMIVNSEETQTYPSSYLTATGVEVLTFALATTCAWYMTLRNLGPSSPRAYCFKFVSHDRSSRWERIGPTLLASVTAAQVAVTLGYDQALYSVLPAGFSSLVTPLLGAFAMGGYFLTAMRSSQRNAAGNSIKTLLWACFIINFILSSSGFLLSVVTNCIAALAIGLFWGSGRMPWRFLIVTVSILSFLNISKVDMRAKYWSDKGEVAEPFTLQQLPDVYLEWTETSYARLLGKVPDIANNTPALKNQSLLDRVNNLQNLLFVMEGIQVHHISTLNGATYSLIPPLLIPRILWPDKPRAHEGQVLLNVHYGRQDLESTFTTYIAWGLLAEAYGNFGPILGAILLGLALGAGAAWIEKYTSAKPLFSVEGLVSLSVFVAIAASFEMVASVMVTSTFQGVMMIALACAPFATRTVMERPEEDAATA